MGVAENDGRAHTRCVAELHESHAVGEAPRRIWKQMCADGWAGTAYEAINLATRLVS